MNDFTLWFGAGMHHILNISAWDHILFVTLLATTRPATEWKQLLLLVTAFTLGHCITLLLVTISVFNVNATLVEAGIAASVLAASAYNAFTARGEPIKNAWVYLLTFTFGLFHGMGFSMQLRDLLGASRELILPLLYFNLGIEAGQLVVMTAVVAISLLLTYSVAFSFRRIKFFTACLIIIPSLFLTVQRCFALFV